MVDSGLDVSSRRKPRNRWVLFGLLLDLSPRAGPDGRLGTKLGCRKPESLRSTRRKKQGELQVRKLSKFLKKGMAFEKEEHRRKDHPSLFFGENAWGTSLASEDEDVGELVKASSDLTGWFWTNVEGD